MKAEDLIAGIDTDMAPSMKHPAIDEAVAYTKFLNKLHESASLAYNFEKHSGFGRDYPGSPMIDDDFSFTEKESEVFERMVNRKPFRVEDQEFLDIIQEAYIGLAEAHDHSAPLLRHDGRWTNAIRSSFYTPHAVFLTGPRSIVTALHEYTHSLGFGEVVAVWWSTNAFKLLYPKSFAKLKLSKINPHLMLRHVNENLAATPDFGRRRNFGEFKEFVDEQTAFFKALAEEKGENGVDAENV